MAHSELILLLELIDYIREAVGSYLICPKLITLAIDLLDIWIHMSHLLVAEMCSFQFYLYVSPQNCHTVFEDLGVDFVEFVLHHIEVLN